MRNMEVQYVGDTLYLPPLEREVNHIIIREDDVKDWEHFEPKRTCKRITLGLEREREIATVSWICSACRKHINKDHNYCHNCGARVIGEWES